MTQRIIIIGGGHAGLEAALAAARVGAEVLLLTSDPQTIGQTPCNPSIGGVAKGHLVHEIEALGGLMGRAADACAIHGRVLNRSKGPAVRSTRVQVDKDLYSQYTQHALSLVPQVQVRPAMVAGLYLASADRIGGVILADGQRIEAAAVVVTTGTFLGGVLHTGSQKTPGGRVGEAPASALSTNLAEMGYSLSRLKTGTPPRLLASTLELSRFEAQPSDDPFPRFTPEGEPDAPPAIEHRVCYMAHTNAQTHAIIREHLELSPMYSGQITGIGPRYCPSIEDKVVRFAERDQHLVFLEPEGLSSDWIYPNGISTSLPLEVQEQLVRSMVGLERAEIVVPGYAVEYDAVDARQLHASLESKQHRGLYFAGQINGTSGYEEAGVQGLLAGANAALALQDKAAIVLGRDQAYAGVLVDDLVTQGCDEPYRMFTSRAEYRLVLREDNASERLSDIACAAGLIDASRRDRDRARMDAVLAAQARMDKGDEDLAGVSAAIAYRAYARKLYAGYIERQKLEAQRMQGEGLPIPADIDYFDLPGISNEAATRLHKVRPTTTTQAARIPGMTPGALASLWAHARIALRKAASAKNGGQNRVSSSAP